MYHEVKSKTVICKYFWMKQNEQQQNLKDFIKSEE